MKRALTAVAAAGTLAAATMALPTDANALPVWVVPAIIGSAVAGVAVGAIASPAHAHVYVAPSERAEASGNCHVAYPAQYGYKRMLVCAYRY